MRTRLKLFFRKLYSTYAFLKATRAFKNRYRSIKSDLFRNSLETKVIDKYIARWSPLGKKVEVDTFLLCYNLSGKIDYDIVPENIFCVLLEPLLNPYKEVSFFAMKNIYYKWFSDNKLFPKAYFHKIDGLYFDSDLVPINDIKSFINMSDFVFPIVLKASKDTYGGIGVRFANSRHEIFELLCEFDFFVCQEKLTQNTDLNQINTFGLNTIRVCLYRTINGKFVVLNHSIRFGVGGALDNETAGGIVCNISHEGVLNHYAVDKYANKFYEHPDTCVKFKEVKIPLFNQLLETSLMLANELIACNLVSLDMVLDAAGAWRCVEVNLEGQTIRFAQYAGSGFFGSYTDEVLTRYSNLK